MWCARYSEATHQDLAGYTTQLMGPLRLARRRGHSLTDGRLARIWVLAALVLRCEVLVLDGPIRAEHVAADVPVIERPGRHGTALVDQVVPGLFGHVDGGPRTRPRPGDAGTDEPRAPTDRPGAAPGRRAGGCRWSSGRRRAARRLAAGSPCLESSGADGIRLRRGP